MVTDHLLIRRASAELDKALARARVRDVGLAEDGRFALLFGGRGGSRTLLADAFGSPPLVELAGDPQGAELSLAAEPAWTRAVGAVLRGLALTGVRARKGDRVIAVDFGSRSRFGVATEFRLVIELVPRFGNIVLLKGETIVAAAKTFSPAENPERSVEVGRAYVPPPLPQPTIDRSGFERMLAEAPGGWSKALRAYRPDVPRLVADSLALEAALRELSAPELADWFAERYAELELLVNDGLSVYRREGRLVQPYVFPLRQFATAGVDVDIERELLPLLADAYRERHSSAGDREGERERTKLHRTVQRRLEGLARQLDTLRARRGTVDEAQRDLLRRSGEALYAHAHEVSPGATRFVPPSAPDLEIPLDPELDAKANAAAYFARYRKAADAGPHLARREAELARRRNEAETLLWEIERSDPQILAEIAADLEAEPKGSRTPRRERRIAAAELPSGARLYVGRSPRENVEITFSIARPNDLWFHARNVPGAHVVLVAPPGQGTSENDILAAASAAASNSRAKGGAKVEVDYTQRKHVRKQRDAAPGMVWYTDFKTVAVAPESGES